MSKIVSLKKKKSSSLKEILNSLLEGRKLNCAQLARNTGLSFTTIRRMASEEDSNPTYSSLKKLAEFFNISPAQLAGDALLSADLPSYQPNVATWSSIPVLTRKESIDWPNNLELIKESGNVKYVLSDLDINDTAFSIIADDESLEPKFSKGTVLIFDANKKPMNKDYVLILLKDRSLPQIRQIFCDGPDYFCRSVNPAFGSDLVPLAKGTKFLGVLIQAKANYI